MHSAFLRRSLWAALLATPISPVMAQQQHRPPAVPLVVNDPFLSIWSMADQLTDQPTKHWSESPQPLTGMVRIDGRVYRWMGIVPRGNFPTSPVEALPQTKLEVTPLHTRYTFAGAGIELHATFFTPLLPNDLDVMSRPVTYLSWSVNAVDGKQHQVELLLDVDPLVAVNDASQWVTWSSAKANGLNVLSVGSRDQQVLQRSGDHVRIDWGYFRLAVPDANSSTTALSFDNVNQFLKDGSLPTEDDLGMAQAADFRTRPAHLGAVLSLGQVGSTPVVRHVLLGYTDGYSIEYLGRKLHGYWQRNGMTDAEMLATAEKDYASLEQRGVAFDRDLQADMKSVGGDDYAWITTIAYRQTIAAHKLVADVDGQPMLFSKENDSNGCIDTVDVTYPSSPFFLLFNPRLLEAQLEPLMRYSTLPRWRFPFAPHDLGTYPLANGQVYGGGELSADNQMPVEESGDLLIMIAALSKAEGNYDFARRYMPQLTRWASYLEEKGLDPENQLSTDDFAGHLAHNTNLSIKAIEALAAFDQIAQGVGDQKLAHHYHELASTMPAKWMAMAADGDQYKLAFDQPGTWSQKYNLVWDDLLGLHLFPKSVAAKEWALYQSKMQPFGLPLDNRNTNTKLDWQLWTASLTRDPKQFTDLVHRIAVWTDKTPSRVPLPDYFNSVTGARVSFQARSVVGGVFIEALSNSSLTAKWRARP